MSVSITSLNSGSNGNCYYIGNNEDAVLVDAGISCRETERRMMRLGLSLKKVRAIFISHEHSDHIAGVAVLSRKYHLPVYITELTLKHSRLQLDLSLIKPFKAYEAVCIGSLNIVAFPKFHDASEPHSFIIENNGIKIGVLTDIGHACKDVIENFKQCHAAFLEANYDEQLLEQGRYPYYLKKRISSDKGHLSNQQAIDLFVKHKPRFMSHLFLSHLSQDNNSPHLVQELFVQHAKSTEIIVASRHYETAVYHINATSLRTLALKNNVADKQQLQLGLF